MLLACLVWLPAHAAERAIDKSVAIPAALDRAWGHVLVKLKKRFEEGPQAWAPRLEQLRKRRERPVAPR